MKSSYNSLPVPHDGEAIEFSGGKFRIPDRPIIPYIEGDGTGRDIWKASQRVFDAAVEQAYGGKRRVVWFEVFAGEKAYNKFQEWLPQETVEAARPIISSVLGGSIEYLTTILPGVWPVLVDVSELELALVNMVVNARDALGQGGAITVTAENVELARDDTPAHHRLDRLRELLARQEVPQPLHGLARVAFEVVGGQNPC